MQPIFSPATSHLVYPTLFHFLPAPSLFGYWPISSFMCICPLLFPCFPLNVFSPLGFVLFLVL